MVAEVLVGTMNAGILSAFWFIQTLETLVFPVIQLDYFVISSAFSLSPKLILAVVPKSLFSKLLRSIP